MNLPGAIVFILMGFLGLFQLWMMSNPRDALLTFCAMILAGLWLGNLITFIGSIIGEDATDGPPTPPEDGDPA